MSLEFLYPGLGSELVDYLDAWELQRRLHADVSTGATGDTVLVLEHAEVYTAGKRTEPHERPTTGDVPVVEVDRGGKITWHGPGQLVVYPVVKLPDAVGVVDYVRRLEEAMIGLFAEYGLVTGRVRGRSGSIGSLEQHLTPATPASVQMMSRSGGLSETMNRTAPAYSRKPSSR